MSANDLDVVVAYIRIKQKRGLILKHLPDNVLEELYGEVAEQQELRAQLAEEQEAKREIREKAMAEATRILAEADLKIDNVIDLQKDTPKRAYNKGSNFPLTGAVGGTFRDDPKLNSRLFVADKDGQYLFWGGMGHAPKAFKLAGIEDMIKEEKFSHFSSRNPVVLDVGFPAEFHKLLKSAPKKVSTLMARVATWNTDPEVTAKYQAIVDSHLKPVELPKAKATLKAKPKPKPKGKGKK